MERQKSVNLQPRSPRRMIAQLKHDYDWQLKQFELKRLQFRISFRSVEVRLSGWPSFLTRVVYRPFGCCRVVLFPFPPPDAFSSTYPAHRLLDRIVIPSPAFRACTV